MSPRGCRHALWSPMALLSEPQQHVLSHVQEGTGTQAEAEHRHAHLSKLSGRAHSTPVVFFSTLSRSAYPQIPPRLLLNGGFLANVPLLVPAAIGAAHASSLFALALLAPTNSIFAFYQTRIPSERYRLSSLDVSFKAVSAVCWKMCFGKHLLHVRRGQTQWGER